jgi:hypothetical protein
MDRSLAIDIAYVGFGKPSEGGAPPSNYTQYPDIHEGSVVFNFPDPTSVNFRVYNQKDPWATFDKKDEADSVDLAIPSPKGTEMLAFCGGTLDGEKWEEDPSGIANILMSLKIQTAPHNGKYTEYIFPKCKILGKLSQAPGVEDTDLLLIRATKQAVRDASGKPLSAMSREVKEVEPED